jgi:hypothetical protein
MAYVVDLERGGDFTRVVAQKLSAIIPFLEIEPDRDEPFFLRIERVGTAERQSRQLERVS